MAPKRRHAWVGFALFAVLGILGLFVLDDTAAGATSLAAILVFVGACIYALRGQDSDAAGGSQRAGLRGWLGGWF
jgi:predicted membrane channel-forming protein YqfA (hemolysin III family)